MSKNYLPQVNIIAACFNSAQYLPDMIESVLSQDYQRVELFIQDGGSTDGSIDILRRYPIQWASEADNGISQALNRAINATQGEIIGITGTDDLLQPGAITEAVEIFKRKPKTVMVYGDCYIMDFKGKVFELWESRPFDLDWLFWEDYIPIQTAYVRRQAICELGGFDESLKLVQDWDMWFRLGARFPAECFEYIPRVQGCYRRYYNSAGMGNLQESAKCIVKVMAKFFGDPANVALLRKGKKRAMAGGLLNLSANYLFAGQRLFAWKSYIQAVQIYPRLLFMRKGILALPLLIAGAKLWRLHKRVEEVRGLAKFGGLQNERISK